MNLIIVPNNKNTTTNGNNLLRFAVSSEPISGVVLDGLGRDSWLGRASKTAFAVPDCWNITPQVNGLKIIHYAEDLPIGSALLEEIKRDPWLVVSN
jgi:hypothetical protein